MLAPAYGLRSVFGTARGIRLFAGNALAAFGLVSGSVQFSGQLFPAMVPSPLVILPGSVLCCVLWGLARAYPRATVQHEFHSPEVTVSVIVGDLFTQDADIVVGFSDTFDTSTEADRVVSRSSLQGQLVHHLYAGDAGRLDRDLRRALSHIRPVGRESRQQKHKGKLLRYAVGTVAVLRPAGRRVFAVAYSRMGNDYVSRSSVDDLWLSLNRTWDAVYRNSQRGVVVIPLVGAGLARIDTLDKESLLKLILLSFVSRAREVLPCRELRVVVWPADLERVSLLEVAAFLRAL